MPMLESPCPQTVRTLLKEESTYNYFMNHEMPNMNTKFESMPYLLSMYLLPRVVKVSRQKSWGII